MKMNSDNTKPRRATRSRKAQQQLQQSAPEARDPHQQSCVAVYGAYEDIIDQNMMHTSDDENVILKLSFSHDHHLNVPDPYELDVSTQFAAHDHDNQYKSTLCGDTAASQSQRVVKLLTEFEEKSKTSDWPSSTTVHCYWCCHSFTGTPVGLPVKLIGDRFHVTGCFCSLECAAAYNFASRDSIDDCLHRYSLINALHARMGLGIGNVVRPAPNRLALSMFGGHMSIDEFRSFSDSNKHIIVNTPPMLTVSQQIEEVNSCEMRSEYKYVPLDNDRVQRFQEKIRLKRSKPVANLRNTLDNTMNLKIS